MNETWNDAAAPRKKGLPTWGKVLIGCGVVALLALGTCVGGVYYAYKKTTSFVMEHLEGQMKVFDQAIQDVSTSEGAARFYAAHPGLAKRYDTPEAFHAAFKDAPERVGAMPSTLPAFMDLMKEKRLEFNVNKNNGQERLVVRYRNPGKDYIVGIWENDELVDLRIE